MTDLLLLPEFLRLLFIVLSMVCVIVQEARLLCRLSLWYQKDALLWDARECCFTLHIALLAMLSGTAQYSLANGNTFIPVCVPLHLAAIAGIVVCSLIISKRERRAAPLASAMVSLFTLPGMLGFTSAFSLLYGLTILFYLVRGVSGCITGWRQLHKSLSLLSVKNAIDTLEQGILFCDESGYIYLANHRMLTIMEEVSGKQMRNGKEFYACLQQLTVSSLSTPGDPREEFICRLESGSAYLILLELQFHRRHTYVQLTVTDITEQWQLSEQLAQENEALQKRSEEWKALLEHLVESSYEAAVLSEKSRVHDLLGHRIALLQRKLRSGDAEYRTVLPYVSGMVEELCEVHPLMQEERLTTIVESFREIGVAIQMQGSLPDNSAAAQVFVSILQEASTNAVRHGFATEITASFLETDAAFEMQVSNNGEEPAAVCEGGGISGMRARAESLGGTLAIQSASPFTVSCAINKEMLP